MLESPSHILALDQGTTSSRSILFDLQGVIVAEARKEFRQVYPRPGWVEHDPMEIWSSQSATAAEALARAEIAPSRIAAVGITNQRETTLVWERKSGRPIYNAIVWQDRRTADSCSRLKKDGLEEWVSEKTGLRLDPYFSATKLQWILDNVDGARRKAESGELCFGTVDSWLLWQLSGHQVHATDVSNASRTLLFNLEKGDWDDELLELFQVPRAMLPEIRSSAEVYAKVAPHLYPAGAPIAALAGDQQSALFGQACFSPGMAKNTYGTGCFLLLQTGNQLIRSKNNLLTTVAWKIGDHTEYALEGSIFIGGAVVQWVRDELQMVRTARELDELAGSVSDAEGLFIVPAFAGLGAPHWDPYARGIAVGMTRGTNRVHFCRAALESIAFQSADLMEAMEKDSGLKLREFRVDGGAARSDPLLQFQADLLGVPVVRPESVETTARGAATMAGLAVGLWKDLKAIAGDWSAERTFEPMKSPGEVADLRRNWSRAVERAKCWDS